MNRSVYCMLIVSVTSQVKFLVEVLKYTSKLTSKSLVFTGMAYTALLGKRLLSKVSSDIQLGKRLPRWKDQDSVVIWLKSCSSLDQVSAWGVNVLELILSVCFWLYITAIQQNVVIIFQGCLQMISEDVQNKYWKNGTWAFWRNIWQSEVLSLQMQIVACKDMTWGW